MDYKGYGSDWGDILLGISQLLGGVRKAPTMEVMKPQIDPNTGAAMVDAFGKPVMQQEKINLIDGMAPKLFGDYIFAPQGSPQGSMVDQLLGMIGKVNIEKKMGLNKWDDTLNALKLENLMADTEYKRARAKKASRVGDGDDDGDSGFSLTGR